jgi:5-methylcytosine-specific restriction endonuclease McrA
MVETNCKCAERKAAYGREYRRTHAEELTISKCNYHRLHAEKHAAYCREYYRSHAEECAARSRKYRLNHPKKVSAIRRAWKLAHRDQVRAYRTKYDLTYRQTHRGEFRMYTARHEARKYNAPGWNYTTTAMICARWEMFGGRCYLCGNVAEATDHVKPLARGGAHWPCNLRPICKSCNSRKNDTWPLRPCA